MVYFLTYNLGLRKEKNNVGSETTPHIN